MAVVTPLNNFLGPEGDTVTTDKHYSILNTRQNDDSMRTPAPTLPPLNPIALCDSQQDADDVCGALTGPLLFKSKNARKRVIGPRHDG